jgi:hypothetical protein
MRVYKGTIVALNCRMGSGLAELVIQGEDGVTVGVPCDNAPTVRALEGAFGNVIAPGHRVNPEGGHIGKEIFWSYDDLGFVLEAFTPVEEAGEELLALYKASKD